MTIPAPTQPRPDPNAGPRDPVLLPPDVEDGVCRFYDDAVFIGDSVSIMLQQASEGLLGDALILTVRSYSVHIATDNSLLIPYRGQEWQIQDVLAACGKKKLFIMLGMNDIAYGVADTMAKWDIMIQRILDVVPDMQIHIQSCTPIYHEGQWGGITNANVNAYNAQLKEYAEARGFGFVNVGIYFKDSTEGLAPVYTSDSYIHINAAGAQLWVKVLKAYAAQFAQDPC